MNNVAGKYIDHKQYTLTVLTIAHADHGRPKLKDDERFRNGFFCDIKIRKLNMCILDQS